MGGRGGESMSQPARSRVLGWGMAVPDLVVTNDQLGPVVDTSDEWIQKRTGIRQRRYICLLYTSDAADDMQCVDLGGRRII